MGGALWSYTSARWHPYRRPSCSRRRCCSRRRRRRRRQKNLNFFQLI